MFVKKFDQEDWKAYRALRLEALALHENVYGGSLREEAGWQDADWQDLLAGHDRAFFGLYDGDTLIGSAGVFTDRADKTGRSALLVGSYIREDYRGQKLSRLLYEARIGWIVHCGLFDRIVVGHRKGNEASRSANQRFGFQYTGEQEKSWGDGSKDIHMRYELKVA